MSDCSATHLTIQMSEGDLSLESLVFHMLCLAFFVVETFLIQKEQTLWVDNWILAKTSTPKGRN